MEVARGGEQEGDQRRHRLEHVLAVVEHQQGRSGVQLLRDPTAYVGLLGGGERASRGHRATHAEGGADRGHHVVPGADADQLDDVHARQRATRAASSLGGAGLADAARPEDR